MSKSITFIETIEDMAHRADLVPSGAVLELIGRIKGLEAENARLKKDLDMVMKALDASAAILEGIVTCKGERPSYD